jgi:putative SOS response-associated peptidase YedK
MCGRYGRRGDKQKIAETFHVRATLEHTEFEENYDVAPGSVQPVVIVNRDGERDLTLMRWGFRLPERLLFNTRSDTAATSKFWKEKLADKRCIIPASSFFEWKGGKGHKTKYEITVPRHHLFGMAGVWAPVEEPQNREMGRHVQYLHNRQQCAVGTSP